MRELKHGRGVGTQQGKESHPSRVRELKLVGSRVLVVELQSHPSRVRELKRYDYENYALKRVSHPSRVRELKQ